MHSYKNNEFSLLLFLCFSQAKLLARKEKELETISSFYKEQLEILDKKVRIVSITMYIQMDSVVVLL